MTNVGRETPLDAGSAAGGGNWDGTIVDVEDEVVAADPAALNWGDAVMTKGPISVDIFVAIHLVKKCHAGK